MESAAWREFLELVGSIRMEDLTIYCITQHQERNWCVFGFEEHRKDTHRTVVAWNTLKCSFVTLTPSPSLSSPLIIHSPGLKN
jgi:hypothetical protein